MGRRQNLVTVEYDFASADFGSFNLFRVITGVLPRPPLAGGLPEPPLAQGDGKGASTLDPSVFQGDTGNGQDADVGYRWMSKKYEFTARSGLDGTLHVLVGVWGTWESPRTYYLDNLRVTLAEK